MKLLTLNAHSLVESGYSRKLLEFVQVISREQPDVIALQEVNQTASLEAVPQTLLTGYVPADPTAVIRGDHHVYQAARLLSDRGIDYSWTWLPVKRGYEIYDEGVAVMSLSPITATSTPFVSGIRDYENWKTRRLLGVQTQGNPHVWFYSVHFGWWDDEEEPFVLQWENTAAQMPPCGQIFLMGDFNNPAEIRGEGYDLIEKDGWHDSYLLAEQKDSGWTVCAAIDGWRNQHVPEQGMRIDQIWCRQPVAVRRSRVLFNQVGSPVVSDHFGVMIELEEGTEA